MAQTIGVHEDGVLVVEFGPRQINGDNFAGIAKELFKLLDQVEQGMLLDFTSVDWICSPMYGQLIQLHRKCQADKVDLRMCFGGVAQEEVKICNLHKLLPVCDTRAAALAAFKKQQRSTAAR